MQGEALESEITFVLFLDLVGYSKLTLEEQVAAGRALHEAISSLETFRSATSRGTVVTLDTGDGAALCFFGEPTMPARASTELKARSADLPPLRMGLHCGPVVKLIDLVGSTNVRGVGINVAQRVMDAADPGAIFLTAHYAEVLEGYSEWRNRIVARGLFQVKHGIRLRLCELIDIPGQPYRPHSAAHERMEARGLYSLLTAVVLVSAFVGAGAAMLWSGRWKETVTVFGGRESGRAYRAAPYPTSTNSRASHYP